MPITEFGKTSSSFIPKEETKDGGIKALKSINFVFLVSATIFVITVVSALGVFLYKRYIQNKLQESEIMITREEGNLDIPSIKKLSRLDKRLKVAEKLLSNHINLSLLFDELEKSTLKNVQFKSLDFTMSGDAIDISMKGVARSYSTIVLQSDAFGESPYVKNPVFSNLDVNDEGDVVFDFSASLDREIISYKKGIE